MRLGVCTGLFLVCILPIVATDQFYELSNDYDDPEVIRVERSDYGNVGGPIAKGPKNETSTPGAITNAPGTVGPGPVTPGPGVPGTVTGTGTATGAPTGAKGGGKGCAITVVPSSVLPEIGSNTAQLPDFNLKYTDDCKSIGECWRLCEKAACNYFVRSTAMAFFYTVKAEKLKNANFVESTSFDSFIPQCPVEEKLPEFTSKPGTANQGQPETTPGSGIVTGSPGNENNTTPRTRKPSEPVDRCPECTLKDKFKKYLLTNNRSYNPYDEERRFKVFQDNLAVITELIKSRVDPADANFTVSKFTDLLFGEFLQSSTGAIPEEEPADKFEEDVGSVPGVPARFDWSDEGVVPEPRDQKDCGSCYAFTTTDLTATQWAIDHGEHKSYVLSPQVVLDCIKEKAAFGCNGGRPYLVLSTHANCTRCPWPKESCYPYENKASDKCRTAEKPCVESDLPQIHVKHAYYLDLSSGGGEKERMAALLQGGPVAALVQVTNHWQFYSGGVMRASQCNGTASPNHAILITGYDYTGPVPAYIVKNSWGKDWGEEGYFRIEAGKNTCGIAKFLSFACTADCGDKKSVRQLLDRAIKRQMEKGFGTTTPKQPSQGYGVQATFPYSESAYGGYTQLPLAQPPPRPPTAGPTLATPEPQPPAFSPPPSYYSSVLPGTVPVPVLVQGYSAPVPGYQRSTSPPANQQVQSVVSASTQGNQVQTSSAAPLAPHASTQANIPANPANPPANILTNPPVNPPANPQPQPQPQNTSQPSQPPAVSPGSPQSPSGNTNTSSISSVSTPSPPQTQQPPTLPPAIPALPQPAGPPSNPQPPSQSPSPGPAPGPAPPSASIAPYQSGPGVVKRRRI